MSGSEILEAGKLLCETASTPEEKKTAAAFRRVFYGKVVLAVLPAAALLVVMFLNNSFGAMARFRATGKSVTFTTSTNTRPPRNSDFLILS